MESELLCLLKSLINNGDKQTNGSASLSLSHCFAGSRLRIRSETATSGRSEMRQRSEKSGQRALASFFVVY